MKTTYSASEARNHFPKLVNLAEKGKQIVIMRYGVPVMKLVAYEKSTHDPADIRAAIRKMQNFEKKGFTLGGLSIRALRDKGRR